MKMDTNSDERGHLTLLFPSSVNRLLHFPFFPVKQLVKSPFLFPVNYLRSFLFPAPVFLSFPPRSFSWTLPPVQACESCVRSCQESHRPECSSPIVPYHLLTGSWLIILKTGNFPTIGSDVFGLLGISAGSYVASKITQKATKP